MEKRYYSANEYFKEAFGCKVYKIALDGGMTCPNRDGTKGSRGCIFCSEGGSGDFAEKALGSVSEQIDRAIARVKAKIKEGKFIAYFQSYTNTYQSVEHLENLFTPVILDPRICALSVATRPDCLPDEVANLLQKLNKIKPVFVELGLQTIHEQTARYIRRGYDLPVFDEAVKNLKKVGVNVIAHVIVGLPYESEQMIIDTARYVGRSGADGIKLQLLHVLKNTDLAKNYEAGAFSALSLADYARVVASCLEVIPKQMVVHRITGDAPKKLLIAPTWSADKKTVLNYLNAYFDEVSLLQGSKFTE